MNDKYHHGDLHAAVIEQALKTIEADGYAAFTLRNAARQIGVDSAAIYRHFKSKEAVAAHVAKHSFEMLAQDMQHALAAHTDAVEKVVAIGTCYISFAVARPNLFELMFSMVKSSYFQKLDCEEESNQSPAFIFSTAWQNLLVQEGKSISTAAIGQFSLWSAVHGSANLLIQGHGPIDASLAADYSEMTCRNMIKGCLAQIS